MRISRFVQVVGLAVLSGLPGILAQRWQPRLIHPTHAVGGAIGKRFDLTSRPGQQVVKLRVHRYAKGKRQKILGIWVEYSDGSTGQAGTLAGEVREYQFGDLETITSMSLWGDGRAQGTGRIKFETAKGAVFDFGQNTHGQNEFPIDVGSGRLVGFTGWEGEPNPKDKKGKHPPDIHALAGVFLKTPARAYIDNVSYPDFDMNSSAQLKTLGQMAWIYQGVNYTGHYTDTLAKAETTAWSHALKFDVGVSVKIQCGVPELTRVETTASFTMGSTHEWSGSETTTRTFAIGANVEVNEAPGIM